MSMFRMRITAAEVEKIDKFVKEQVDFINEGSKQVAKSIEEFHNEVCRDPSPRCLAAFVSIMTEAIRLYRYEEVEEKRRMN